MYVLLILDSMQINFVHRDTKTYYTLRLYQLKKPIHNIYIFFQKHPSSTFIFMMTQFSFTSLMSKTSISIPTYF